MWPTPRAKEAGDYQYSRGDHDRKVPTLSGAVKMYNTPTAQDAKNSTLPPSQISRDSIVGDVLRSMYPTPTGARLCGGKHAKEHLDRMQETGTISETEKKSMQNGSGGQLNPDWVEWLMGFPTGWTRI